MRHAHSARQNLICVLAACIIYLACIFANARAQNAPIAASGLNTQISGPIPVGGQVQYDITGGTRPNGGPNLFHSFGEFGVPNNTIANFHNNSGLATSNILGRVTGGNISNIFGAIQTTDFGSANLFLMNPAGFLFGPNASLDVGGMVSFTSADYLKLKDGTRFNAAPNPVADAMLSAAPVAAFGFLGGNSASIAIQGGTLEVADGKTLSFIGGPRVFTTDTGVTVPSGVSMSGGSLSAPNGLIYLATVAFPGEVPVPTLSGSPLGSLGSPSSSSATIRIRSGEFVMDHASLTVTNTSQVDQSVIEVTVQGAMELKNASSIDTSAASGSTGRGGDIAIEVRQATLRGFSTIRSDTAGQGDAGRISIHASDSISLVDSAVVSNTTPTDPMSAAKGGPIILHAPRIEARGSQITSSTDGSGNAGTILIETQSLMVKGAGDFSDFSEITARTEGPGPAGQIMIRGTAGPGSHARDIVFFGNSQVLSETVSSALGGNAGSVTIDTTHFSLGESSAISTAAMGTAPRGLSPGHAGNITINATGSVTVSGGTITTSTETAGSGGNITVTANHVQLHSGATITANSNGVASAGNINITATDGLTMQNSSITTLVDSNDMGSNARGGDITITTSPTAMVHLQDSKISASVPGKGDGGNVSIDPQFVVLQNSRILAQADQGRGGNITIITSVFQPDTTSIVSADAGRGVNGTVTIQSPYAPAGGQIQPLGNRPLQVTSLLNQGCAAVAGGQFSSFTVTGRNSLPTEPGGWLSSPLAFSISQSHGHTMTSKSLRASHKPTGGSPFLSLRHIAPPGFLIQAFATPSSAGCAS